MAAALYAIFFALALVGVGVSAAVLGIIGALGMLGLLVRAYVLEPPRLHHR